MKSAAVGMALTLGPLTVIASLQLLFAPQIVVAAMAGIGLEAEPWMVPSFRKITASLNLKVALLLALYWGIVAALGRGKLLRIWSADLLLLVAALCYAVDMLIFMIPASETNLKGVCPLFDMPDTHATFGFDGWTPCEGFVSRVYRIALIDLPLILMIASASLRVVISRLRTQL